MTSNARYCASPFSTRRWPAREVSVGRVGVGGENPVRVQSMTISHTHDVDATVAEILGLVEVGCEIVRMTVASRADAAALPAIVERVRAAGHDVPFVADIHYSPAHAMAAVEVVEKVRINPGNYVDKKRFDTREITDKEYEACRAQVEATFAPLVRRAKERGVALRVGVNHGSLSDRMVNRFGDSPLGMVESALEYLRMCVAEDFHDVVISMKSSNPIIMVQAYRLLVARMAEEGMDFPLHLGVTEAGEGREGRVKSAVGIGALLEDGLGDTIRVSLTENAAREVPVARALARRLDAVARSPRAAEDLTSGDVEAGFDPFTFRRRNSRPVLVGRYSYGGNQPPRVELPVGAALASLPSWEAILERFRFDSDRFPETLEIEIPTLDAAKTWVERLGERGHSPVPIVNTPAVSVRLGDAVLGKAVLGKAAADASLLDPTVATLVERVDRVALAYAAATAHAAAALAIARAARTTLLEAPPWPRGEADGGRVSTWRDALLDFVTPYVEAGVQNLLLGLRIADTRPASAPVRVAAALFESMNLDVPFVLIDTGRPEQATTPESYDAIVDPSVRLGSALVDGFGDAVRLADELDPEANLELAFDILQATRMRTSKAEFISCPSCGRTLFDLETTSRRIRELTGHLKGVKIGIMGCLVNGPGEMADADFGYVGWKVGRVNLYVGQECVVDNVPEAEAGERLIELIKEHGRWVDPPVAVET